MCNPLFKDHLPLTTTIISIFFRSIIVVPEIKTNEQHVNKYI